MRRLKEADTDAEKAAILEEVEQVADLVSLDEMRFPLLEFIQRVGKEAAEELPLGIHAQVDTKGLSSARLHIFDPCGHWLQVERSEEFNTLVLQFLANP